MTSFRLIHASDFHFSTAPGVINPYDAGGVRAVLDELFLGDFGNGKSLLLTSFSPDMASAFSCDMEDFSSQVDAIVLTGDLATTGDLEDIKAAHSFFVGNIPIAWSSGSPSFVALHGNNTLPPLVLMPGNHDRYTSPSFYPRSLEFENIFGSFWNFFGPGPDKFSSHRYVRTTYLRKDGEVLALCAVDFSLHDANQADLMPFSYLGQGVVSQRSHNNAPLLPLDELVEQTEWARATHDNVTIIWCVHYPPYFPNVETKLRLIGEDSLIDHAERLSIKLILSGHTHEFQSYLVRNIRVVCCGTTTGASQNSNGYLELTVDTTNVQNPSIQKRTWDVRENAFV